MQILHAGRYGLHADIVAPSAIRAPINRRTPRALTGAEVEQTVADFVASARFAKEAGYDGVEVMGSEGYLINQFLVRHTNRRDDSWGGPYENRMRFALKIVSGIRQACGPAFAVVYRLSLLDLVDDGSSWAEVVELARAVEAAGADAINSGIGWHEARVPTIAQAVPRGAFVWRTAELKSHVDVPVIAVNRINMPELADEIVASGRADLVSLARPFLADEAFVAKAKAGRADEINTCIACNQSCLDHIFSGKTASCLVNPRAGRETELAWGPAAQSKRIAVVGAGPAGMACAAVAAERGHAVTLFDAAETIGGQLNLARRIPGKAEFDETIRYFTGRLARAGVALRLGAPVSADALLAGEGYDHVVLASGIVPRVPAIPGIDHASVIGYRDLLAGRAQAGERVAVIGGGGIAFDVALYLLEGSGPSETDPDAFRRTWGIETEARPAPPRRHIVMLQRTPGRMGQTLGKTTGWIHRLILKHAGVEQISGVAYTRIDDDGLHIAVDGDARTIVADTVVLCAGQEPRAELAGPLERAGVSVHVIGGARDAARLDAARAFEEGTRLGAEL
jgi:2,4-dienoyl-CoA reductase (NADPH2)